MSTASRTSSESFDPKSISQARKILKKNAKALPRMAALYKLLANPVRLKILISLSDIERMCVGDLAQVVNLSFAATSHQLKILKDGGWLHSEGDGKLVYYRLAKPDLKDALEGDLRMLGA